MIRISQIKLPIEHAEEDMKLAVGRMLKISSDQIKELYIIKKSIDARKKNDIRYIYTVDVQLYTEQHAREQKLVQRANHPNISLSRREEYRFTPTGELFLKHRPVIVGFGPAGLFCAYLLAKMGYQPLVVERGYEVERRVRAVEEFWRSGELNEECNVQFGEGGAGTFSDGKLNTMVSDVFQRYPLIMKTFVSHGAPSEILYLNKPHIGTDKLKLVVESMRKEIISMGGQVRFGTKLTDLQIQEGSLTAIELNHEEVIPCEVLITAIGHSARDTFTMFRDRGLGLTAKAFAIGLRIEHKQERIGLAQYGPEYTKLPAADYKLTHQTSKGRGVYSFCMCPGGFVVNSSSEKGYLAVNGMSNYLRDEENANSAIVVTVGPEDFGGTDALRGMEFQRKWEEQAYRAGQGNVPVQLFGDLLHNRESVTIGAVKPNICGKYRLTDLRDCLPPAVMESIIEGILNFGNRMKGFSDEEAVLSGVETRTSSPVRILRNEFYESNISGLYPCGEGAGYAGGITSAAMDGIKVFEAVASKYRPSYE